MSKETFRHPYSRAPVRLFSIRASRQAMLRTSLWLAPSRVHQQALRPPGGEDARCVQPTSATQTIAACTRTSRVPGSLSPLSRRGVPTKSWAPRGTSGDLDVSRRPWSLRRIGQPSRNSSSTASRPGDTSVGVFFPRRCCDRASDTPVAILRFTLRLMRLRACCVLTVRSSLWKVRTGWRVRKFAKTTVAAVS